jgi:sulfate adenylyltransferase large subunit
MSTIQTNSLLRFVTCGSVDDGKSTLIGRLLYDSKSIFEDQLQAVEKASTRFGTTGGGLDLALLTDGLKAEREQGITIDVAYRYFSTPRRPFIIADCPGHEQYTRNMATGASTAHVAILLIDARYGVVTQTRRHAFIVSLLGIRHVVLAVNKMDLANWEQSRFEQIVKDFEAANEHIGLTSVHAIPMSALNGDNVTARSSTATWYTGPTLLEFLETVDIEDTDLAKAPFRMPVQLVSRPHLDFRGYMGEVASGSIRPGEAIVVLPGMGGAGRGNPGGGVTSRVTALFDADGPVDVLSAGQAGTITLEDEIDASRGDVLSAAPLEHRPHVNLRLLAQLVWFSPEPLAIGQLYRLKQATRLTTGIVTKVRHRVDINTLQHQGVTSSRGEGSLQMNDIALVELEAARPLVFDAYKSNRAMGSFILIDPVTGNTAAAGMVVSELTSDSLTTGPVTPLQRAIRLGQRPVVVSLTGDLDVARETAELLESLLFTAGHLAVVIAEHDAPARAAAVRTAASAGLITLLLSPTAWPTTPAELIAHITPTTPPEETARLLHRVLKDQGHLSAPISDFSI